MFCQYELTDGIKNIVTLSLTYEQCSVYKTLSITMECKTEGDKCLVEIFTLFLPLFPYIIFLENSSPSWSISIFTFEAISDNLEQN